MLSCLKLDKRGSQDTTVFAVKESQRRNKKDKRHDTLSVRCDQIENKTRKHLEKQTEIQ